uniref:Reverse transcriptase domain-containing protein n=1 Tax=Tanacetum cinerariifolium TaxID=118510 RepID=A0A6L2M7N4_TANCI|nr:reverse transcriptase domain-containing protein [Tanacetum cinerariifolium]
MKAPIVFPPLSMEDASDEPLIIKAVVEGYLVRRDEPKIHLSGFLNNTLHGKVPHPKGVATLVTWSAVIYECQRLKRKQMVEQEVNQNINQEKGVSKRVDLTEQTLVNPAYPDNNRGKPVRAMTRCTKKKGYGIRQNLGCEQEGGRMDYYPLSDIDGKIESVVGFRYKCFMDAYKGYHQVQMAHDDKEKTALYMDEGTYCYTKMPFRFKNARATYQRVVDTSFQSQIGINLEAYVDDMVIKSNNENVLIEDITETLDNLQRINMKLNPKNVRLEWKKENF